MSKWRLLMQYISDIFRKQTTTLLSWPICTSIDLMLIITSLKQNHYNYITTNTKPTPRWNGMKRNRRLQLLLLREVQSVNNTIITSLYAKYADIFEEETTKLLSGVIYISIDFMVTMPFTSRTTGRPKQHYCENQTW